MKDWEAEAGCIPVQSHFPLCVSSSDALVEPSEVLQTQFESPLVAGGPGLRSPLGRPLSNSVMKPGRRGCEVENAWSPKEASCHAVLGDQCQAL